MLRALPVPVSPFPRETPDSYAIRLCRRNGLSWAELWHLVERADPRSRRVSNGIFSRVPDVLCRLGGLEPRDHPQLTRRWTCKTHCVERLALCGRGHGHAGATFLCRRCSHGEAVEVLDSRSPVCVRHRRWCADGHDIDVAAFPDLLHAGRMLGGTMRLSELTISSPEARFLRGMLYGWQDRGDRTARTQVALARQMADLPLLVRGMLLLASEDFLRLVECGPAGLAAGTAHVRAFLRRELAAPARTRLREKLHAELGLEPDSDDDESDIDARLSEDLDGNLWDRWYGDVPGLQRMQILEELSRTELAVCRGEAEPAGPRRTPDSMERWSAVARRSPAAYPTWYRW
ncbi:hypothetical protein EJ130_04245 [Micrococcus luteus]|uniref:hypothetical protein n=1 Tax=Micrococcus luteus TaxID=1270 RepID=UPI0022B5D850|nr:hypothetical protein [Micrococcus luteus]MCZ6937502.1 hypothetical protein [Micrococcus luteus]